MAKFITTIELREASDSDYDLLHAELSKASFKEKRRHILKTATGFTRKEEYNRDGNISLQDVTSSLMKALVKTGKKFSFTIIRGKPGSN